MNNVRGRLVVGVAGAPLVAHSCRLVTPAQLLRVWSATLTIHLRPARHHHAAAADRTARAPR